MDLRSLLQDVLSEVSSEVISFQTESHSIITWVRSSDLFQNYRIFEDMHHGITKDEYFQMAIAEACDAFNNALVHFGYT